MRLDGKVAVITGAATGIGRATAVLFAQEGARVVFGDVNDVEADETLRLVGTVGGEARFLHCDVRQTADVERLVQAAVDAYGQLDVMMNNVGVNFYGKVHETTDEDWSACLNLNLGSVRNVSVVALSKNLADELGPHGINVNTVHPGTTRTERTEAVVAARAEATGQMTAEVEKQMAEGNTIRHLVDAREVAYVVTFLCSPKALAINGDVIAAGGGALRAIHY